MKQNRLSGGIHTLLACLLCMTLLCTAGCSKNADQVSRECEAFAQEQTEAVLNCILQQNSVELQSLFSEAVQDRADLQSEIQNAFSFLDGNIISYDAPTCASGPLAKETGVIVSQYYFGTIDNIVTDTGRHYKIRVNMWCINPDASYLGIEMVNLIDTDQENQDLRICGIGQYME